MNHQFLYKVVPRDQWQQFHAEGRFSGSPVDKADGYIHLSTSNQLRTTLDRHFSAMSDLLLVELNALSLGDSVRWESSRNGELFPHLYGILNGSSVVRVLNLPLGDDNNHEIPGSIADS